MHDGVVIILTEVCLVEASFMMMIQVVLMMRKSPKE